MENMNNLVFHYDSSEHGSLMKKVVAVISNCKEIEFPYPFQKPARAPAKQDSASVSGALVEVGNASFCKLLLPVQDLPLLPVC